MSPTIVQAVKMFGFLRIKCAQSGVSLQKSLLLDKPGNKENPIRYYGNSITTELSSVTDAFKHLPSIKTNTVFKTGSHFVVTMINN